MDRLIEEELEEERIVVGPGVKVLIRAILFCSLLVFVVVAVIVLLVIKPDYVWQIKAED